MADCEAQSNSLILLSQLIFVVRFRHHTNAMHSGSSTKQSTNHQHATRVPEGLGWDPLDLTADDTDIEQLLARCK